MLQYETRLVVVEQRSANLSKRVDDMEGGISETLAILERCGKRIKALEKKAEIAELTDKVTETLRERSPARQKSEAEYIKQLAGEGAICEVFGHWWEVENDCYRTCKLCPQRQVGRHETGKTYEAHRWENAEYYEGDDIK